MKPIRIHSDAQQARWCVHLLAGLSVFAASGAVLEWLIPSSPPFSGRLAWIVEAVFALMGSLGLVVLWLLLAVSLTTIARFIWRHAAKAPTDKWLW